MSDTTVTDRQLESGLGSGPKAYNEKTGRTPAVHHRDHHHHHHHHHHRMKRYREKMHHRKKQRVENKLPGIMQGANNLEQASRRLSIKNELVAALGEFCGTFLFLFFSYGIATIAGQQNLTAGSSGQVQSTGGSSANTSLDASQLLYSSLGFGFSLAVNAWLFFRVSGGLFNPAVTLALFLTKNLTWYRTIILGFVQFVGAIAAAGMCAVLIPGGMNARTKLAGSTSIAQGFFIEFFMTAQLVFAVFMLAGEKHKGTFLAPVGIGLALFVAELWATPFTGGSLNPARTLGPDVIAAKFDGTTWIYYVAPFAGAVIATIVYKLLRYVRYETAVEGQDGDDIHLVMRDDRGHVTGFVDQVAAAEAPEIVRRTDSMPGSPSASVANLGLGAGTDTGSIPGSVPLTPGGQATDAGLGAALTKKASNTPSVVVVHDHAANHNNGAYTETNGYPTHDPLALGRASSAERTVV